MNRQRVHLQLLTSKYPGCADRLIAELGKERQGPTVLFEDYGGEGFKRVVAECANHETKPIPVTARRALHGAAALVKAALKIDPTPPDALAARRAACETCPELVTHAGLIKQCRICKCIYEGKIRNAGESCPLNPPKWGPVNPAVSE